MDKYEKDKILNNVISVLHEYNGSEEIFDMLNSGIYAEASNVGVSPRYNQYTGFNRLKLDNTEKLYPLLGSISSNNAGKIISKLCESYHTNIDQTYGYENQELIDGNFNELFDELSNNKVVFDETIEFAFSIERISEIIINQGFEIPSHEKKAFNDTLERIKGSVTIEMTMLWGIMKQDIEQYKYFKYSDIGGPLDPLNIGVEQTLYLYSKRVNGVSGSYDQYSKKGKSIINHVLQRMQISVAESKIFAYKYEGNVDSYNMLINRLDYCIEEGIKLFSSST